MMLVYLIPVVAALDLFAFLYYVWHEQHRPFTSPEEIHESPSVINLGTTSEFREIKKVWVLGREKQL